MATAAGGARYLSVKNAVSERDLLLRETLRHGKLARVAPGVGMNAFRRHSLCRRGRLRDARRRRRGVDRGFEVAALIGDAPNSSVTSSEIKSAPSGATARPEGRNAARPGSLAAPAKPS